MSADFRDFFGERAGSVEVRLRGVGSGAVGVVVVVGVSHVSGVPRLGEPLPMLSGGRISGEGVCGGGVVDGLLCVDFDDCSLLDRR